MHQAHVNMSIYMVKALIVSGLGSTSLDYHHTNAGGRLGMLMKHPSYASIPQERLFSLDTFILIRPHAAIFKHNARLGEKKFGGFTPYIS